MRPGHWPMSGSADQVHFFSNRRRIMRTSTSTSTRHTTVKSLRFASAAVIGLGVVSVARPVMAQGVVPINSVAVQERRFNDFPNSTLVSTDNYPAQVGFAESNYGTGGFANQHVARFAVNEMPFEFQNNQPFAISVTVNLDAGTDTGPDQRKEAGFRSDTFVAGESFFIVTADGEVAAFGGPFP